MNLTSKAVIRGLLKGYGTSPLKRLGQNFLISQKALQQSIKAAELKATDTVLEIGPGIGTLTQELSKTAKKVIAIEKDQKMITILKDVLKDCKNVEIINKDILKTDVSSFPEAEPQHQGEARYVAQQVRYPRRRAKLPSGYRFQVSPKESLRIPTGQAGYKVVANLPYYIAAPVIRKFLEVGKNSPNLMVLMVQKEVAQRICAKPPKMNLLGICVQFYAEPKIVSYVSKRSFWPQPKVDGAIIKITPKSLTETRSLSILQKPDLCQLFFRIVKAGFAHPRKQLINNLSSGLNIGRERARAWLLQNNIQPSQRAQDLTVENWIKLTENCKINIKDSKL